VLLLLALLQQIDSTVPVVRGQRLEVSSYAGEIAVKTWARNAVRVQAELNGRTTVEIDRSATSLTVRTEGRRGPPSLVDLQITAPAWMALDLSGVNTDVTVVGARGPVTAETVQGQVDVEGGVGLVSLQSVQGSVSLSGAKGRLEVHSVNEDVLVKGSSGEVTAETVNGDITLSRVDATSVMASSVNGELDYDGTIKNGGRYAFSTHNGDITITVPEGSNAAVSVATFNGDFASEFPVTLTETRKGKRFSFTIGTGSAQMTLESFQGSIELVRPGSSRGARDRDHDRDHDHDEDDD
jgi:putative adhesin